MKANHPSVGSESTWNELIIMSIASNYWSFLNKSLDW